MQEKTAHKNGNTEYQNVHKQSISSALQELVCQGILGESEVQAADENAMQQALANWKHVCKPLGSLGLFEDMVVKLAGIYGTPNVRIDRRCAIVVCADNGVVDEGVTQSGKDVTLAVAESIAEGLANINVMADAAHMDTFVADVGMEGDPAHPKVKRYKVAAGTCNMTQGPAMTRKQAIGAIGAGIALVKEAKEMGYQLVSTGEMGIGNTTTSSAIASVLLGLDVETVTGRGAGLSSEGLERKIDAIRRAIACNQPDPEDPLDVLAKLGGFDIAAMTGMYLGGGICRIPIVIDGVISSISALLAQMICPEIQDYMLASHVSEEPAGKLILEKLGLEAPIHGRMRLGEGTGAVCLLPLLDITLREYHCAHKFGTTGVEQYEELH